MFDIPSFYRVFVWDRATGASANGLWEAAAAGKVNEDAFEVHNKAAAWSSTTQSFELDLLEVTLTLRSLRKNYTCIWRAFGESLT